jgi:hypothetical protein
MKGEISYDLVMKDEMRFVEGTFRIDGGEWQVVIFGRGSVQDFVVKQCTWDSGVSGIYVSVPPSALLNKEIVERILKNWSNVPHWIEVRGPDSMQLR